MIPRSTLLSLLALAGASSGFAASDILPPLRRTPSVELAQKLAVATPPAPLPGDLVNPFAPADFSEPDPDEERARLAAEAASKAANRPASDRELLERISAKLSPSGSAALGGDYVLLFPGKRLRKGDRFVITFDGRDFELELTDIQRTTFSLRYNRTEITRPIKLGKNQ